MPRRMKYNRPWHGDPRQLLSGHHRGQDRPSIGPKDVKRRLAHRELSQIATELQTTDPDSQRATYLHSRFKHLRKVISRMDKEEGC